MVAIPGNLQRLLLFDAGLPDLDQLLQGVADGWQPLLIQRDDDALTVVQHHLSNCAYANQPVNVAVEIAVVAHGAPGIVHIGSEPWSPESITRRSQEWSALSLTNLDLYSCFVGQDIAFLRTLERISGASVSASTQAVGHLHHSGTWRLQSSQAANRVVPFNRRAQESWQHSLADLTATLAEMLAKTDAELDGYDNLVLTDISSTAADLTSLKSKTTTPINANSVQTVSGTALGTGELGTLYADLTGFTGLGNESFTVTNEIYPSDFNRLLGYTSGSITATLIDQGINADFAFYADKVTTGGWGDAEKHAITYQFSANSYTGTGNAYADNINIIQKSTSVDLYLTPVASAGGRITGTADGIISLYSDGGVVGLGNEDVLPSDASISVAEANTIDASTTGVITATITETDAAILKDLTGTNAYTITVSDSSVNANHLIAIDAATTEILNVDAVETISGSTADISTALDSAGVGTFNLENNIPGAPDVVALVVSGTPSVAEIQALEGKTSGVITATVGDGDIAALSALTSLSNTHELSIEITDAVVRAEDLLDLAPSTTLVIDADTPTTLTGAYVDIVAAINSAKITGLDDVNITPDNSSLTTSEVATLRSLTSGSVNTSGVDVVPLPSEVSSIAVDQSTVTASGSSDFSADADADGSAQSNSIDGAAIASNSVIADAGVRNSDLIAGSDLSIDVDVLGNNEVTASTVNARSSDLSLSFVSGDTVITASAAHGLSVYDAVVLGDGDSSYGEAVNGFTEGVTYYVSTIPSNTTFTLSTSPGGDPIAATGGTSLTGFLQEASAFSAFTGDTGGIIDDSGIEVDITSGSDLAIDSDAITSAISSASNVDGDASAQTNLTETYGIENIGVSVGGSADVLADAVSVASAFAETTGASGAPATATSDLDVGELIGLKDLGDSRGDFVIAADANIDAAAGNEINALELSSSALSASGDANASASTTRLAGIYDSADKPAISVNIQLILDYSGSMKFRYADTDGDGITDTDYQGLQTEVVQNLIQRVNDDVSDAKFQIIAFTSSSSLVSDWGSAEETLSALNAYSSSGGTNYKSAINTAIDEFNNPGKAAGPNTTNLSFFFSDGAPNSGSNVDPTLQITWEDHLVSEGINSFGLGIGTAAPTQYLNPIDYDGINDQDRPGSSYDSDGDAYVVSDPAQLDNILNLILDEAIDGDRIPSYLEVGGDSVVEGTVDAAIDVSAETTDGNANASNALTDAVGIDTQFIESGGDGSVAASVDLDASVTASTVDGSATATQAVTEAKGADLQTIDVGASAIGTSQAGVQAIADIDLITSAQSTGDAISDSAVSDAQVDGVMGLDLSDADMTATGSRGDSANSLLKTGDAASVLAVADLSSAATSTSVDGNTEAVVKVGADDSTATGDAAIGFNLDDAAEIGGLATIDGQALASLAATASTAAGIAGSGETRAAAGAEQVAGVDIDMVSGDVSSIADSASIQALAQVDVAATADANEGTATAEAGDLSAAAAGLNNSSSMAVTGFSANETITAGSTAQLDADAVAVVAATAQSIDGTANSTAKTTAVTGSATSVFSANGDADLSADARSSQSANSGSISGDGSATATTLNSTGLDFNSTTTLGADAALQGTSVSNNAALAASNLAIATATANAGINKGVDTAVPLAIGDDATITGVANLNLDARASTQGDDASADAADANSGSDSTNLAMDLAAVIGGSALVVADADLVATAVASGVVADASSDVDLSKSTAIDVDQQTISTGGAFTADASSQVSSTAEALTRTGDASAVIDVDQINGLDGGDLGGSITSGQRLQLQTEAIANNVALATAVDADAAAVTATIDNDLTRGMSTSTLTAGESLALSSTAKSSQLSTAQNLGDGTNDQPVSANAAVSDNIQGIANSTIASAGNADQLNASAALSASAIATNQAAASTATLGSNTAVTALDSGVITIGQDATNPVFAAETSLTSKATSTNGAARADSAYRDTADPASVFSPAVSTTFEPSAGNFDRIYDRQYSVISINGESHLVTLSKDGSNSAKGFRVYNVDDPDAIQETAYVTKDTAGFSALGTGGILSAVTQTINGAPYLFLSQTSSGDETITVVDLANPTSPSLEFRANTSSVPNLSSNIYGIQAVEINNAPYLLVSGSDGLQLLDTSNPSQLSVTRTFADTTVTSFRDAEVVSTNGGQYLVATSTTKVLFADVSNPSSGSQVILEDTDPLFSQYAASIGINTTMRQGNFATATIDGSTYAYFTHSTGLTAPDAPSVVILDITNPLSPSRAGEMLYEEYLSSHGIELWSETDVKTFAIDGVPYLAVLRGGWTSPSYTSTGVENMNELLHIFDISNPGDPAYVSTVEDGGDIATNTSIYPRSQLNQTTNRADSMSYEIIDGNRFLIIPTEGFNEGDPPAFQFVDLGPVVVSGETTTGIKNSTLTVDGSVIGADGSRGSILTTANGSLLAEASSLQDDATSNVAQVGQGLKSSTITIADDGNLDTSSTLEGRSIADVVGNNSVDDLATANLVLDATGVKQTGNQTVSIGDSGLVSGQASISGEATSSAVAGAASSAGNLDVSGISLQNAEADITVANSGDIRGLAVIGALDADGTLSENLSISATAQDGVSTASATFDAAGISGNDGGDNTAGIGSAQTLLSSGLANGDLIGQVLAGGSVSATTTGDIANTDDASVTISTSNLAGLENIDLRAGQSSGNLIKGTVFGQFDADAISTYGDTTASSDVNAFGIVDTDSDGFMSLGGGIAAIAQLSNSVTARTESGNASVTLAAGDALALSGFITSLNGEGILNASALSDTSGRADSVIGNAIS